MGQRIGAGWPDMAKRFACATTVLSFCLVSVTGILLFITVSGALRGRWLRIGVLA